MKIILYKKSNNGKMIIWTVESVNEHHRIRIEYGEIGGRMQIQLEDIVVNQSGRSQKEQCWLRMTSRANKKLDLGYKYNIPEAEIASNINASGLFRPMLAQKLRDVGNIDLNRLTVQYKYNGHRCLITNQGGELIAYSRNGKLINSIGHILKDLVLPEDCTIDGELYIHGMSLQKIGSLVRKPQELSKELTFVAFDMIDDSEFMDRYAKLCTLTASYNHIELAPTAPISILADNVDDKVIMHAIKEAKYKGYEGLIFRQNGYGYEIGKRSKSVIKGKLPLDGEFLVVDIVPSVDGWAVLVCECVGGIFRVNAPGTISEKNRIMANKHDYIGRHINMEFFEWTDDFKPFHPVAIYWRDLDE